MDELTKLLEAIRAVRDTPAVHRLCLDVYSLAQRVGESAALTLGAAVFSGVREYDAYERELDRKRDNATAGKILGERPLPAGGEWWGLLPCGLAVPAGDKRCGGAVFWCSDSAGWWRVPAKESQAGRAA